MLVYDHSIKLWMLCTYKNPWRNEKFKKETQNYVFLKNTHLKKITDLLVH